MVNIINEKGTGLAKLIKPMIDFYKDKRYELYIL
ncbi:hypothetical protein EMIT079MI2_90013 [Bacillus sp. IT-79MI2]